MTIITGARSDRIMAIQPSHNDKAIESNPTESGELFETICDTITGLFHLSLIIQRATPRDRFAKAMSAVKDVPSSVYDVQHVVNKFPKLDGSKHEWLREKLGKANTQRRIFFNYCRDHYESKAGLVEKDVDNRTVTQTVASTLNPGLLGQVYEEAVLIDDNFSQTSFATSVGSADNDGILHVPRLNTVSETREEFQCPYCCMIINPQSQKFWK